MSLFKLAIPVILAITAPSITLAAENSEQTTTVTKTVKTDYSKINSVEVSRLMGSGWNLGNTLEAIGGETSWGNPETNRKLIKAVKDAGFKSIRIPVAWSRFSDGKNFVIDKKWMARVEEVVKYARDEDLYIVLNMHWDGGWMQPTYAKQDYVNNRMRTMWTQIANHFQDYDEHLLFAGTNEVMVDGDYGTPKPEYYNVQNGFNQVFIDTVRATGGNNANRFLVVQGFNTNIEHTLNFFKMPDDSAKSRMLVEVHYYEPYNFTLNKESTITQWGRIAQDTGKTETWANETFVDAEFQKMKRKFIDKNVGVILGEYAASARFSYKDHEIYRAYWDYYIASSAIKHGITPMYWDSGMTNDNSSGLFNRKTGEQVFPGIIKLITKTDYKIIDN